MPSPGQPAKQNFPPPPRRETRSEARSSTPSPDAEEIAHWQVLGLSRRVTLEELKKQHRARIKAYHPDKVAALGPKLRELAEEETKKINAAYEFLCTRYGYAR